MTWWCILLTVGALLIVALGGWITQGATVAVVLSLAGAPVCF